MFEINVHREALEKRRRIQQQRIRALLLGAFYVTLLVLFVGLFMYQLLNLRQRISAKELEMQGIQQILDRYDPEIRGISPEKLLVLSQVKGNKIKWGTKLKVLSSLLPSQMWLKEITLEEKIIDRIRHEVFLVSGTTHLPEESEGLTGVLDFLNTLRNNQDFSEGFESVELLSSKRAVTSEKKKLSFEFICIIR